MAAEMSKADNPFLELKIPIVTGDNLFYEEGIDSFLIDNREGIRRGVDYLVDKGHSHIVYLAENIDIFNFIERREAFVLEINASAEMRQTVSGISGIMWMKYMNPCEATLMKD